MFLFRLFSPPISTTVIIPTYNESPQIKQTIQSLHQNSTTPLEIIVVDAHSTDRTPQLARRAGAKVLSVHGGRAAQLNAGARVARASTLLFLHADTTPPPNFDTTISQTLASQNITAGAFRLGIASERPPLRIVETVANWRSKWFQRPYGDQGLFLKRERFEQVGGYPQMPFLEDYEMSRRLSRNGKIMTVDTSVQTSARRWETLGIVRTTLMNQAVLAGYHVGVPVPCLRDWYRGTMRRKVEQDVIAKLR